MLNVENSVLVFQGLLMAVESNDLNYTFPHHSFSQKVSGLSVSVQYGK